MSTESKKPKKKKSFPHTRAIQRDRQKRPNSAPPDETIEEWIEVVVHPAALNQVAYFHQLGLRERILSLPVMVAFVLSLIWRQLGSIREAVRVLGEEGMLWVTQPVEVSPQAVQGRLGTLPPELFERVMKEVLPQMQEKAEQRKRPLPPAINYCRGQYEQIMAADGSVLDGLLKKIGLLQKAEKPVLAGKIMTLIDSVTQVPAHIWYDQDSKAHDQRFWERIFSILKRGVLLLLDAGFVEYERFDQLTDKGVKFVIRPKKNASYSVLRTLSKSANIHDVIIRLGSRTNYQCQHEMRLVKVLFKGKWYWYLTNELDPIKLPATCVVALYDQRWRIEDAFNIVKRLLGLAYFYSGSINAVQTQLWMTWLLYAMLVDLTDSVADALGKPFKQISMEMVYRGLYHFAQARKRGLASDPIEYFARKAKSLSLVKQKRRPKHLSLIAQMELTIPKLA